MMPLWLMRGIRIALAIAFLWAATFKITGQVDANTIYGVLIASFGSLKWVIISTEVLLGLWLASGVRSHIAALIVFSILCVFSGTILVELMRSHPKPCGCMSSGALLTLSSIRRDLVRSLLVNVVLIIGAMTLIIGRRAISTDIRRGQDPSAKPVK